MGNKQTLKLFVVLVLCTSYIFSFSHFGTLAYDSVMNDNDKFAEGTMIGSVSVAGMTSNEALQSVNEAVTKWLNETTLTVKYKEKSVEVDLGYLNFDLETTILQAKPGQTNEIFVQLEAIDEVLASLSSTLDVTSLNMDELEAQVLGNAKTLQSGSYEIRLETLFINPEDELSVIKESKVELEENDSLDLFSNKSIEIGATTQFSFLQFITDQQLGTLSSDSLSKLAGAMYEVILPTNFAVIEKHISRELPNYASLGYEAKVDAELQYDFIFTNPNEFSYFIEFEKINNTLVVSLKGPKFLNRYEIKTEGKETFKPKKIVQFNPLLEPTGGHRKSRREGRSNH